MSINTLLEGKNDHLDYDALLDRYPWIVKKNQKCILSPDSDGLLCGLFMSHYFNWEIVGYYDGKVMLLKEGVSAKDKDCVFLDMEIYRRGVKSVGHHMVALNNRHLPEDWMGRYSDCVQPNNLRKYDKNKYFRLKYPLATIHLLLGIVGHSMKINILKSAIAPLFFVDGTFNVLFGYPENVLNWLKYMGVNNPSSPLKAVFQNEHFSIYEMIQEMDAFFRERDKLNIPGERGDKFVISSSDGSFKNVVKQQKRLYSIESSTQKKLESFIKILERSTGWKFTPSRWAVRDLKKYKFTKGSFQSEAMNMTIASFEKLINMNPLSWAITSSQNIEFTLETPDSLP